MIRRWAILSGACGLLLVTGGPAIAAIYRWIDEDGVVTYTDNPWQFESYRRQMALDRANATPGPAPATREPSEASRLRDTDEAPRSGRVESAAAEVMRLSGLDAQLDVLAGMARGELERLRLRFSAADSARDAVARTLGPEALRHGVHRALARRLDQRTALLLAWLRAPLSRRIVALESAAPSADRAAEAAAFINRLPSAPPAPARLALVHRADRAGEVTETSALVIGATIGAVRAAVAPISTSGALPRGARDPRDAGPAVDEVFRFRTVASLLFTYRDLRDAELERYVAFLESPTGRWFTRVARQALLDALRGRPG
jgi:hypothetical protein